MSDNVYWILRGVPDWFDISRRLRRHLLQSESVYGYRWIEQCGHWVLLIIKRKDVYKEDSSLKRKKEMEQDENNQEIHLTEKRK